MPRRPRSLLGTAIAAATVAGLLSAAPAAEAAVDKPDLQVKSVQVDRATITEGAVLTVRHAVQNRGKASARASVTRFYLTTDVAASLAERRSSRTNPRSALGDVLLEGRAPVATVRAGRSVTPKAVKVMIPVGTPPARYTLLACADDQGRVKESDEADNCTPSTTAVRVSAAAGSDSLSVQTFSDTYRWPDDESSNLQYMKIFCSNSYPAKSYTLSSAISSVRAELEELAPGGLAKVDRSGLATTPVAAQGLAASALAQGSPGLALAALLKAHALEPGKGTHLVNAAALATSIGLPNQAIAFLDAALGRDFLRPAVGIPHQAAAAVVRGQALVMTGRYDAAQRLFVQAKQLAPILSEADAGLATVAACKGQNTVAARYLRRSRIRSDDPVPTTPPTEDPVQPAPNVDTTRGHAVPLRQLPIAETPVQAADMHEVYDGIANGFEDEIQANIDEANRIEQHLRDTDDLRTRAEIDRRDSLFVMLYQSHLDPEVEAAQQALFDKIELLTIHNEEFWGGGTGEHDYTYAVLSEEAWAQCQDPMDPPNCFDIELNKTCRPELVNEHTQWRGLISEAQTLANQYFALWSKQMTGVAANLIDEEAHQYALNHIDGLERDVYALLVQQAQFWTHNVNIHRDHCVEPLPAELLNPPANEDVQSPGKCQGALKAMNLRATLGPSTVKISCERIEQGFAAEVLPLLAVFVDVKYDFRTGHVSVYAGSRGGGTAGGVVEAGFKSGIYLKVDSQGELVDAGWRVGPSLSVGAGSAEFGAYEGEIDMSFTSSLTPGY